jgi:hypothetical protein
MDSSIFEKIVIIYPKGRRVSEKGFVTDYEVEEQGLFPHKLVDRFSFTNRNEIDIKMYYSREQKSVRLISGGNYDFVHKIPPGTVINFKLKFADDDLKKDIVEIARDLCEVHLRKGRCYPGILTTTIRIEYFEFTSEEGNDFIKDFSDRIIKKVAKYGYSKEVESDGETIISQVVLEENETSVFCPNCQTELHSNSRYCGQCGFKLEDE